MKALFFHAAAGNPRVARALMGQAVNTLRPFERFVGQAIHTAKSRQFRYQLPWERVRNLLTFGLDPIDTLLRVPKRTPGVFLTDWPSDASPDLTQPGFVMNRGLLFHVESATPTPAGLRITADVPLRPSDRVTWCAVHSPVLPDTEPRPPSRVATLGRAPLELLASRAASDDPYWLLVLAGKHQDGELVVDDELVEAQALSAFEDLSKVFDSADRPFELTGGALRTESPPADGTLRGNNGVRFRWSESGSTGRRGNWVQLLLPESSDADETLDPRAAFCEGEVREVWSQPRQSKETTFRVKKVDQDRYQLLLDRFPPADSLLHLPVDLRNLYLQKRAMRQLAEAPLPHHHGLLRLCEDPTKTRWPPCPPAWVADDGWYSLKDPSRSGTEEQRDFVRKALGATDFAFLEGPPGSGKTTAICEIVQQLVKNGQRVLLCASTHAAIDNVLERLLDSDSPIDAVRIGKPDKVDDNVQATLLDERVKKLVSAWRERETMQKYGDRELEEMAKRAVVMAANLTCGTTMGIVSHPLFRGRDEDISVAERPIASMPHWDVLIVDEASKTLIQEFMVPALMARRWVIVGDVQQLPPFADRADLVASLRDLVDKHDRPAFSADHQRACLLLHRLTHPRLRQPGMRWLLVERPAVLEWISRELDAGPEPERSVVRVVKEGSATERPVSQVTLAQLRSGSPQALHVAAADWVLVSDDLLPEVADYLPSNLLLAEDLSQRKGAILHESHRLLTRQAWWLERATPVREPYRDRAFRKGDVGTMADCQECEWDFLQRKDWAGETAWRVTRLHELRHSRNDRERKRLRGDLASLAPRAVDVQDSIAEIEDIGLPSILEVLQEGIGSERATRRSALTMGMKATCPRDFEARFKSLTYQHRMHADIAAFSREHFYDGRALRDANTIELRDARLAWDFGTLGARRAWTHVTGRETGGVNSDEVRAMASVLRDFIVWARAKGPPARDLPAVWEVACLCFYAKQEGAISDMLREVTQDDRKTRFSVPDAPVEIVCGTVDRFQGREADLVLLSLRNTRRVGFLDSPNRLNVGLTRARQQLVLFGEGDYFAGCRVSELEQLAKQTRRVPEATLRRWRQTPR